MRCNVTVFPMQRSTAMYQSSLSRHQSAVRAGACGVTFPSTRAIAAQRRREHVWAWVSLGLLILCWDASLRLDEKVPLPRLRIAHAGELESETRERAEAR
jgi:hypothetical protein